MSIRREEFEQVDLSDGATEQPPRMPAHPGRILADEFMQPLGLSANRLARALRVPPNRISTILSGRRAITPETALRLGRFFDTSAEFWINLQSNYELAAARLASRKQIEQEVAPCSEGDWSEELRIHMRETVEELDRLDDQQAV